PAGIDDLVQFQIESIDARYCDNLTEYWENVKKQDHYERLNVRPLSHQDAGKPEGKGWVVEVAGFTYHHGQAAFIRETLRENRARRGEVKDPVKEGEDKDKEKEKKKDQPVVGRVTNVILFKTMPKSTADGPAFELIHASVLDQLLTPPAGDKEK